MKRRTFCTGVASGIALTAGCAGVLGDEIGTVRFYVSDQPNRIEDFEYLHVTISAVAFKPADEDDGGDEASDDEPQPRGGWEEYDLDDQTLDLTELQGDRATMLDELEVPAGEYNAVDLFVDDIEAVLTEDLGGGEAEVTIPSETLRLRTPFTVEADEELDFVYDIAPHEAGRSDQYVLTPVISESGTDVAIEEVDARVGDE